MSGFFFVCVAALPLVVVVIKPELVFLGVVSVFVGFLSLLMSMYHASVRQGFDGFYFPFTKPNDLLKEFVFAGLEKMFFWGGVSLFLGGFFSISVLFFM